MKPNWDPQLVFLALTNAALLALGAIATGNAFIGLYSLQSMASQVPEIGFLAIGVMLAMTSGNGGIDLSGIALANLAGVFAAVLVRPYISPDDFPILFTAAFATTAIVIGVLSGAFNGVLISRLGLTPILCTLGTQLLFTGLTVVLSDGRAVAVGDPEPLDRLGNDNVFGAPISFVLFCGVALLIGAVLRFSTFGLRLRLLGTNPTAARFAGFPRERLVTTAYALSGLMAGIAGVIIAARNVNVKWDYGGSYLLTAILVAVMAGVKPEGGHGRMICVFLSATALQLLSSMLNFLNFSNFFQDFAWGLLLLFFLAVVRYDLLKSFAFQLRYLRQPAQHPHGSYLSSTRDRNGRETL